MQKNLNIEKITFKVVQMKFLAMHITNQKLSFYIFTVGNLQNIFMEHDLNILMIFGIKEKCIILTPTMYCCLLLQIYLCCLWLLLCSRDTFSHWADAFIQSDLQMRTIEAIWISKAAMINKCCDTSQLAWCSTCSKVLLLGLKIIIIIIIDQGFDWRYSKISHFYLSYNIISLLLSSLEILVL